MDRKKQKHIFLLVLFIDLLLFVAIFFLMNFVQKLLYSDVRINLTEIVTQNKDVITSKLMLEMNDLDLLAKQLSERYSANEDSSTTARNQTFLNYTASSDDENLYWANADGQALYTGGQQIDISGRQYFRLALEGTQNISERVVSRMNGDDIFVISVPIKIDGKVIGTLQRQYNPADMYRLCSLSLFSEQGFMYIINSEGYILISSEDDEYSNESSNFFRMLYLDNPVDSKKLQQDIQNSKAGFTEARMNGEDVFSAYTPLNEVYDWYLISSIPVNAVSPNTTTVIKLFYFILFVVVLFFACILFYYLSFRRKQQQKLEKLAFWDTITHGSTYAKFSIDLQNILLQNTATTFYLSAFDINNFKYINSLHGYDVGDSILKGLHDTIAEELKETELIARVNSDHFLLLITEDSLMRIRTLFASDIIISNITISLTAGLYWITDRTESPHLMMDKANIAAQKIKGLRTQRLELYSEKFELEMAKNEELKHAIEFAFENDEFVPFFQPKVNIETRTLVGAEALARWRTADGKLISPGEFIPLCEKTGLIMTLDFIIFEKTLQFIRTNLDNGIHCVPISVNFSRVHFLNNDFLTKLFERFHKYDIPPDLIELELTETVIFDNYENINDFINNLHANGIHISMDDFGSGYSSLHMLKDISIDTLKIDRGFLIATSDSNKQKIIFDSIVQMAKKLDINLVVEGVEYQEHVSLMQECGCFVAQGYFYMRPMDMKSFQQVYKEGIV